MRELVRSNDPVFLSYVVHLLEEAGIESLLLDGHMSVLEGSIGVLPRRLMVPDEEWDAAETVLAEAEAKRDERPGPSDSEPER